MIFLEFHAVRAKPIFEVVSLFHLFLEIKGKSGRFIALKEIPEHLQAGSGVQFPSNRGKLGQMSDQIRTHTGEIGAGFIDIPLRYRDGDVTVLHHTVVGAGYLREQHLVVLFAEMVQPVLCHRKQQGFLKFRFIDFPIVDGDLGAGSGIQRIEEL